MRASLLLLLVACAPPPSDVRARRAPVPDAPPPDDDEPFTTTATPTPTTPVDEEPLPAPPFLPTSVLASLADDVDDILAGTTHSVRIVDAENGQIVYESEPDLPLTPASNTKLFTTATAIDGLGEDHRHRMRAFAPAQPDAQGRVGSLTVVVEHDSTWSYDFYEDRYFAPDRLAERLYDAGLRDVSGTLTLAGEVLVDGWSLGTFDPDFHRDEGVAALEDALALLGIDVGSTATSESLATPAGVLLAERESPTLGAVAHPLNVYSHNEMADILADHVGWELGGGSSYADGEAATLGFLDTLGIDTADVHFVDGSGLSHDNTTTARVVSELLLAMQARPAGQAWERTFAIAGVIGTIDYRMTGDDTFGRVYAKTGSLWNAIALSGVLYSRHDGHRYVFSILQDDVPDQNQARALADDVVERLAVDLRGGGERVGAPVLSSAVNLGDGTVEVRWDAVPGAAAYGLWTSSDGRVWDRADAIVETGTSHVVHGLPTGAPSFVRVMAFDAEGESEASDVYAVTPATGPSSVLIVDANDRWDVAWENTRGAGHDFARVVAEAVPGVAVDTVDNAAVIAGDVDLTDYAAVFWLCGEESTEDATFDPTERDLVAAYLDGGGQLLVSGAEIGWDLGAEGTPETAAFYEDWLHAAYVGDDAATFTVTGSGVFDGLTELSFYTPARMVVDYPDQLAPRGGATAALAYVGGDGGTAAVVYDGPYRVVTLGFPVESIDGLDARAELLERVVSLFGL